MSRFSDTIRWYNEHAEEYAKKIENRPKLDQLDAFCSHLPKKAIVLDAGCAAGRDANLLAKKGYVVVGMDIAEGLIKMAKQLHPTITFIHGSFLAIPYPKNYFDGVWAHASMIHFDTISEVKQALREFWRVLKKDGWLHVLVKAQLGKHKTQVVSESMTKQKRFVRFYTQKELTGLLTNTGYSVESFEHLKYPLDHPRYRKGVEWLLVLVKKVK